MGQCDFNACLDTLWNIAMSNYCNFLIKIWLATFLVLTVLVLFTYKTIRKPYNFPPGPRWWPMLGSAMTVQKLRDSTGYLYSAMAELAKTYGPMIGLKIGKDRIVVLCDYESMKDVLFRDEFDGRPNGIFFKTRTWGEQLGILLTDSEFWMEQRKFMLRHLREFGFGRQTMGELVEKESAELVRIMQDKVSSTGTIMEMNDLFGIHVLNTLWTMMAGYRYDPEDMEVKKLQTLLTKLLANVDMVGCPFSQFPILRYIAPEMSGYKEFVSLHQELRAFLQTEVDKHKLTIQLDDPRDFIDVYLREIMSDNRKSSFSELQLLATLMDLFIAGSETTSKSLGFGFLYLILYPEVQQRIQAEIDMVVGQNRLPTFNDRPNMPYTEATVLESLRMFMGRTFNVPHRVLRDTKLKGYDIPKDTMVICNFHCTLMDKNLWGDPEVFRPDRFIDEHGKVVVPEYLTPFGLGKHRCMGEILAKSNIFMFTAVLLQNFNFGITPGCPPPSTEAIDGVTASPKPFTSLVTPRL